MTREYIGRVNGPARMKNFRGMNPASSEINQDPNGALTMVNCDISTIGSVKMRKGWIPVDVTPALPDAVIDGVFDLKTSAGEALIVVCDEKIYRIIGNASTDITAALTITAGFRWRGDQSHDHVFIANGVNQPLVIGLTGNAVTYSAYSIANSSTPAIPVGVTIDTAPDADWNCTAHGLLNGDQIKLVTTGTLPSPFVVGTTYYIVNRTTDTFQLSATLGGSAITYTTAGSGVFAYSQTGVDQTPSSWVSKPPHGFVLLNQLGAERMWAWNLETVFYSAISEPWDYVGANNAGFIDVRPGDGDSIVATTGSYGYVAVMMQNRTLIYNGTGPNDLALSHVLPMGCTSADSIMTIGDDIVFLSPYGPSNLKRFINGTQLIQNIIGFQIAPLMHQTASLDGWGKCVAYHDIVNRRVIWWLPEGDLPTQGFVYQYDVQSWPGTWEGWTINCVTRTSGNQLIAGTTGGQLMILNQGGTDNGAEIIAYYSTAWFDKNEPERNMTCPFIELWLRASGVTMSVTASWDYGDLVDAQDIVYENRAGEWGQAATDNAPNVKWWGPHAVTDEPEGLWQESSFQRVRTDIYGIGRAVQFTFQMRGSGEAEILAYRPDLRSKGLL
jgi:hypothetical protein